MSDWKIRKSYFDGVWSQGEYVSVLRNGREVKAYSSWNPIAGLLARLYILRHRIFG